eukprot:scpid71809/ scgid30363/ Calcium uptake protein 1, mitochondrial; Calcium-binding atopy-related autoantigen 1 homolog
MASIMVGGRAGVRFAQSCRRVWSCQSGCVLVGQRHCVSCPGVTQHPSAENTSQNRSRSNAFYGAFLGCAAATAYAFGQWNRNVLADESEEKGADDTDEDNGPKRPKRRKPRLSFHDRNVMAYEDRIRSYSTPDKIFRYFATLKTKDEKGLDVIMMTPQDFVRAILRGQIQPEGYGLDQFKRFDMDRYQRYLARHHDESESNIFVKVMQCGLISFSDYLFLITILSTPSKHFEIAFRMFDLNGDGELQLSEFDTVRAVIAGNSPMGMRHRDHFVTGNVSGQVGSGLTSYFFGQNCDGKLTYQEFQAFVSQLKEQVLRLEFNSYSPWEGKISELDLCHTLLTYTGFSEQKQRKFRKRVKAAYGTWKEGISFEQFLELAKFTENVDDMVVAFSVLTSASVPIGPEDMKLAGRIVAGVELSDHLVEVLITMFDEDGDGKLSEKEFVQVLRKRQHRGLDSPMDTGFSRVLAAAYKCMYEQFVIKRQANVALPVVLDRDVKVA